MQENGRHGISALQRGMRLAGYSAGARLAPFDFAAGDDQTIVVQMAQQFDCNGQSTVGNDGIAVNTYKMDTDNKMITCMGNSPAATAMPLIEGVDAMRILYGIDSDGDDFSEQYVPYDASWNPLEINSLRMAILVNSMSSIRTRNVSETHFLLDEEIPTDDRISRRVFTTTVMLRNRR